METRKIENNENIATRAQADEVAHAVEAVESVEQSEAAAVGVAQEVTANEGVAKAEVTAEERALNFLAARHPDDESVLERLTEVLGGGDDQLMETLYRGLQLDERVMATDKEAYVRGRNDAIREIREARGPLPPTLEGVSTEHSDFIPLLRTMRRSVWD